MPEDDVTAWALAAGAGDRVAATAFVRATQVDLWRFLAHLTSRREADDLTQETYLRALRSLPHFAGRSSARKWLYAVAQCVAVDHVRLAKRRPQVASLPDWQASVDDVTEAATGPVDEHVVLTRLIADLPPDRWEAFVATQVLGLSYEEAAEVCGCPVGTIRSRVGRARVELIAAMKAPERSARGRRRDPRQQLQRGPARSL